MQNLQVKLPHAQAAKSDNRRTGLVLASVALMFFLGVIVKRMWLS